MNLNYFINIKTAFRPLHYLCCSGIESPPCEDSSFPWCYLLTPTGSPKGNRWSSGLYPSPQSAPASVCWTLHPSTHWRGDTEGKASKAPGMKRFWLHLMHPQKHFIKRFSFCYRWRCAKSDKLYIFSSSSEDRKNIKLRTIVQFGALNIFRDGGVLILLPTITEHGFCNISPESNMITQKMWCIPVCFDGQGLKLWLVRLWETSKSKLNFKSIQLKKKIPPLPCVHHHCETLHVCRLGWDPCVHTCMWKGWGECGQGVHDSPSLRLC